MSSVDSEIKCPQCKYEAASSYYDYKRGGESIACPRCGYRYQQTYECNGMDEHGNLEELWKVEEHKGFGCLFYTATGDRNGQMQWHSSDEDVAEAGKFLQEHSDIEGYVTRWDEETGKTKLVVVTSGCDATHFRGKECPESMVGHIDNPCMFCGCVVIYRSTDPAT